MRKLSTRFSDFARRKTMEAHAASIAALRTIGDGSGRFSFERIGSPWTAALYDGPFHLSPAPAAAPAVSLVFVRTADGNTGAENPGDLGGGDTDKHLIYEGL